MNLRRTIPDETITSYISIKFFLGNPVLCCRLTTNTAGLHWIINFAAARSYLRLPRRATDGDGVQVNNYNLYAQVELWYLQNQGGIVDAAQCTVGITECYVG